MNNVRKVTIPWLPGWTFEIRREGIFRFLHAIAPNGYCARVAPHEMNPNNVLAMLVDDLVAADDRMTVLVKGVIEDLTRSDKSDSIAPCETPNHSATDSANES